MKLFSSHQSITPSDDVTSRPADTAAKYDEALAVLAPTPNHNLSVLAGRPANIKLEKMELAELLQTLPYSQLYNT